MDHAIWVFKQGDICIIVPAYVNDLMIATKKHLDAQKTLSQLSSHFKLRDLRPTSFILGALNTYYHCLSINTLWICLNIIIC